MTNATLTPEPRTFAIDGSVIDDIASLYAEFDRVLMPNEPWRLGESLDALDDLLYGGIGELVGAEHVRIVWNDHAHSLAALGRDTTLAYYDAKIARPDVFNVAHFTERRAELTRTGAPTYFDLVRDVFAAHPEIELVLR